MEEIKVGEYVRDYDGFIVKVNEVQDYKEDDDIWYEEKILKGTWKSMVVKHSPNIIDLIEVGDYVNRREVVEFECEDETILAFPIYTPDGLFNTIECYAPLEEFEIKTILTKEQFNNAMYEVK